MTCPVQHCRSLFSLKPFIDHVFIALGDIPSSAGMEPRVGSPLETIAPGVVHQGGTPGWAPLWTGSYTVMYYRHNSGFTTYNLKYEKTFENHVCMTIKKNS